MLLWFLSRSSWYAYADANTVTQDDQIYKIFLDPSGLHLIISMTREECLYFHASYKKPKNMLKKHVVSAVGFDRHNTNPDSTGSMLLGTLAGVVCIRFLVIPSLIVFARLSCWKLRWTGKRARPSSARCSSCRAKNPLSALGWSAPPRYV